MRAYLETRIDSERLVLRPLSVDDAEALFAMYVDPDVMQYMSGPYTGTLNQLRERLATRIAEHEDDGFGLYATELRETGELIGRCGHLRWTIEGMKEIEVGYLIARAHWGKGYATEAARALLEDGFGRFGVPHLISLIHPENVASQRVAEHNGLQHERDVAVEGIPFPHVRLYKTTREAFRAR
ncbi:MAG: GNAT family N-acetyltransferase [Candidatus Eremiobacteraeota bacterium]|nr:GNAT family N-acetyltransferase [Candidatus Eremiobacteraeota bacterium]